MNATPAKKTSAKATPAKQGKPVPATKSSGGPAAKKAAPAKRAPVPTPDRAAKTANAHKASDSTAAKRAPQNHRPAQTASPAPAASTARAAPSPVKAASSPAKAAPAPAKVAPAKVPPPPAVVMPPGVVPRKGKGTPKYFVAPVQAPLPPPTSRFADRFAPPRPPTRQMNQQDDEITREKLKPDPKLANAWKGKRGRDLTDDEVLAMPETEYMNDKQLEFFREKLKGLKDDLLSNAGQTTENLREDTSIVPDPADRATIEEEHALELRTRDRERKLLKKISQSLTRVESGEYGFCDETGEPIGLGRLIARPTATLSLEAQQRRELKQKMFGD